MSGIGTDILRVARIEETLSRLGDRFAQRILTPVEQSEFNSASNNHRLLAKRFAAKEAIAKALGTGIGRGVSWQDMEIGHDDAGAPQVTLRGGAAEVAAALGARGVALSIADELDYVVAFAMLQRE